MFNSCCYSYFASLSCLLFKPSLGPLSPHLVAPARLARPPLALVFALPVLPLPWFSCICCPAWFLCVSVFPPAPLPCPSLYYTYFTCPPSFSISCLLFWPSLPLFLRFPPLARAFPASPFGGGRAPSPPSIDTPPRRSLSSSGFGCRSLSSSGFGLAGPRPGGGTHGVRRLRLTPICPLP